MHDSASEGLPGIDGPERLSGLLGVMVRINSAGGHVASLLMWVMVFVVCLDVAARVLGYSVLWVGEVSVYLLIAIAFLGAGYTYDRDGHFAITGLVERLPRTARLRLELITVLVAMAFTVLLMGGGIGLMRFSMSMSLESPTLLRVPLAWPYALVVIGGLSLLMSLATRGVTLLMALRSGSDVSRHVEQSI